MALVTTSLGLGPACWDYSWDCMPASLLENPRRTSSPEPFTNVIKLSGHTSKNSTKTALVASPFALPETPKLLSTKP